MTQTRPPEKKAPKKSAAARERLATWIASRGLKATRQREVIVDAFFAQAGHLSVDELLHKAKERDPTIGAATVYRTMKILTDAGLASARHFEGGQTRYEAALDRHHHDHLICTSCGNIIEDRVAENHGFTVTHHKLELYGLCRNCKERQAR